ncbi:MAG: AmmeMemoRadiSam system protein B [Deltaproteobacteria bacterium]|nr:AmmeMemoRadiSam system protein B [Deltaproteobacteria bacterium]
MKSNGNHRPRKIYPLFILVLLCLLISFPGNGLAENAAGEDKKNNHIFDPVPGIDWYPHDKKALTRMVHSLISKAKTKEKEGRIIAAIAPHAGFHYSGQCAAYAFKPFMKGHVNRVIILAPSHMGGFRGLSILKADYYGTPLGNIKIDTGICDSLLEERLISTKTYAHLKEHSLDNMLPFLQVVLKDFKLVPILVGALYEGDYQPLAEVIRKYVDKNTVIVVSSDFTHYGSSFGYMPFPLDEKTRDKIKHLDDGAIEKINNLDFKGYQRYLSKTGITICGKLPIGLLLNILEKDAKGELVQYHMSGDRSGRYDHSVSYASIIFHQ